MTVTDPDSSVALRPTSVDEAAAALRDTSGPLLFRGAGTKQQWGGRPAPSTVVETAGLTRVLAYNPADMTVAVEAGLPLCELQEVLAEKGQWLAYDPPSESTGATVGGLLASGDSGPRRMRYGGLRDLVIGITLVLSDGTVARSGGRVIKNVAGYDLPKLLYGSLGTLGLVAEVVLRLHPRPATSATASLACSARQATDVAATLKASPLEPSAVDWVETGGGDGGRLAVRFEGTAAGVGAQRDAAQAVLSGLAAAPGWHTGDDEDEVWRQLATEHQPAAGDTLVAAAALPTRTAELAAALAAAARDAGADARLASRPALGLHTARLRGPAEAVGAAVGTWRTRVLEGPGAAVLVRDRPGDVDATVDAVGPPPSSLPLLRSLKQRLDPDGRCAPGRLGSWY